MTARPPVWVVELAARFWAGVPGGAPPFPRDLVAVVAWLPHVRVAHLSHLTLASAAAFLDRAGVPFPPGLAERPLRGCMAAYRGSAFVLLDAADDPAERRFTLPHEMGHFLRDYAEPRRKAVARLCPAVLEVLDGDRPPTPDEQIAGVLRGVTVGCHTHLLGRGEPDPGVRESEDAADRLAFELLAPFDAVADGPASDRESLAARLVSEFGLPPGPAARYAAVLLPAHFPRNVLSASAKN